MEMEKVIDNIREILDIQLGKKQSKCIFSEISLNKKSAWQYIISLIVAIFLAIIIGKNKNTVEISEEVLFTLGNVMLALLAMIVGAYALLQALLSDELLWQLISSEDNMLMKMNEFFKNLSILYLIDVIISYSVAIVVMCLPNDFGIFDSVKINNVIAISLLFLYFMFTMLLLLEIKNFVMNLYTTFYAYSMLRIVEVYKHKMSDDEESE